MSEFTNENLGVDVKDGKIVPAPLFDIDNTGKLIASHAPGPNCKTLHIHGSINNIRVLSIEGEIIEKLESLKNDNELIASQNYDNIKEVTFSDLIKGIGVCSLANSKYLEKVVFPDNIKEIPNGVCSYCENLKEVVLGAGVEKISAAAFMGCNSLEKINLPEGLKELGVNCFWGCNSLKEVNLPVSLESCGINVFGQKQSDDMGAAVYNVPDDAVRYMGTPKQWNEIAKHESMKKIHISFPIFKQYCINKISNSDSPSNVIKDLCEDTNSEEWAIDVLKDAIHESFDFDKGVEERIKAMELLNFIDERFDIKSEENVALSEKELQL